MSNVTEHFEALQVHLAQGQERAVRLGRLLGSLWDEIGHPTILVLPEARALLTMSLQQIGDDAANLGIELDDTRWVGVVALTHNASTRVPDMIASEAPQVAALLAGLQYRVRQLRDRRQSGEVKVRLS